MQELKVQTGCGSASIVRRKLQCISAAALSALERQLCEQRLPLEEKRFLAARLESYRQAAMLASNSGCGRADCCVV